MNSVESVFETVRPNVVVNCIGIVKQSALAEDPITTIEINSLFPHRVAGLCEEAGARLVHVSTDCVFSGRSGLYNESDIPDPVDLYGRSKLLGEVEAGHALTIRTSIIGRELDSSHGLLEWFLGQEGKSVRGFTRAIFSGFPTLSLARRLAQLIEAGPSLSGIWHLASEPISKYDLLLLFRDAYDLDVEITRDDDFACDRSLNGSRLTSATGIHVGEWRELIEEMAGDPTPYPQLRAGVRC
jgi:dTDP-4-dehydrorhamnose reductase